MRGEIVPFPDYSDYSMVALLKAFAAGPERMRTAIEGLSENDLHARPRGAGTWSIHEIVLHSADSELQGTYRMRKVFAEPGSALPGYDQVAWARGLGYDRDSREVRERALALLALLREQTLALFEHASDGDWLKSGLHPEFGEITLRNLLELYADHTERHAEQIVDCRRRLGRALEIVSLLPRRLY